MSRETPRIPPRSRLLATAVHHGYLQWYNMHREASRKIDDMRTDLQGAGLQELDHAGLGKKVKQLEKELVAAKAVTGATDTDYARARRSSQVRWNGSNSTTSCLNLPTRYAGTVPRAPTIVCRIRWSTRSNLTSLRGLMALGHHAVPRRRRTLCTTGRIGVPESDCRQPEHRHHVALRIPFHQNIPLV